MQILSTEPGLAAHSGILRQENCIHAAAGEIIRLFHQLFACELEQINL